LYDVLLYHRAVRLAPFIELVTHSATVNHGGGLRKERERVYANPCHHAQTMFAELAGATPVVSTLQSPDEPVPHIVGELRGAADFRTFPAIDALPALTPDGSLLISVVHRGSAGPIRLRIALDGFPAGPTAEVRVLSAAVPWASNTLAAPAAVQPADLSAEVREGKITLEIKPYSVLRVRVSRAAPLTSHETLKLNPTCPL
jgi:alpha-N-arabinofuranosidase